MTGTPPTDHRPPDPYRVLGADLRAQIAQGEFFRQYPDPDHWLPYIRDAFTELPNKIARLVSAGEHRWADYWLLQAEVFTAVISRDVFQRRVRELGPPVLAPGQEP